MLPSVDNPFPKPKNPGGTWAGPPGRRLPTELDLSPVSTVSHRGSLQLPDLMAQADSIRAAEYFPNTPERSLPVVFASSLKSNICKDLTKVKQLTRGSTEQGEGTRPCGGGFWGVGSAFERG